jgi:hypothetical protein
VSLVGTTLLEAELLSIRHVICRASQASAGGLEYSDTDTIVFPVRGVFVKHLSPRVEAIAEPTQALIFASGRPYRISHPLTSGDECLVLAFSPDALRDAFAAGGVADVLSASGAGAPARRACA